MNDKERKAPSNPGMEETARTELGDLCSALCDAELTPAENARFTELLRSGFTARQFYLRYLALHLTMRDCAGRAGVDGQFNTKIAVERLVLDRFSDAISSDAPQPIARRLFPLPPAWLSAAIVLVAVSWGVLHTVGEKQPSAADIRVSAASSPFEANPSSSTVASPTVAQVTHATDKITWRNPNASYAVTSRVRTGESLAFHDGKLELTYASGTRLVLAGPAEFDVLEEGGRLRLGELVARVPEAGHGFTIETQQGKVVDRGTEFGVVVDDFGVSQVSVFEGKVEATPMSLDGGPARAFELTSGKTVQWDGTSFVPIRFQDQRTRLVGGAARRGEPRVTLTSSNLNPEYWMRLGKVQSTPEGAALQGDATGRLPHVVTIDQFDPTAGEVKIECDLRFAEVSDAGVATLTLLTRAASMQSIPGKTWESMLAHAVRCRMQVDLHTGDVRMEVGTKQEADREPTRISWGGFTEQNPNARYHLVMSDDGLTITFTVSLADDPTVSKTITCRSLFRGYENHVAIEGPANCVAVLDDLIVTQNEPHSNRDSELKRAASAGGDTEVSRHAAEVLDHLAPQHATLLFRDDFSAPDIDPTIWSTLGKVAVVDGHAQLGVANKENHIDTWEARPYLLTAEPLDFNVRAVTVVGAIQFDKNFLNGYGGSFAVMTRADNERGEGPGWENSILKHGVRSNLWPAAFGFEHSVELHEKLNSNTLTLLAAKSFQVIPKSRDYAFRVTDDGATIEATFIDIFNPSARGTLRAAAQQARNASGRLGLESCWGSPVLVDEVRVYLHNPPE